MELKVLDETYKDYSWVTRYETNAIYELKRDRSDVMESFVWEVKPLDMTVTKTFDAALNADYVDTPQSFGMFDEMRLIGIIETGLESWNKRVRVTQLWVDAAYHRQGVGRRLMNQAQKRAQDMGYRALILETQSSNFPAIAFYKSYGFELIGFDLCSYSNDDVENQEVRFELAYIVNKEDL